MMAMLFLCVCQNILFQFGRHYPSIAFVHLFTDVFICLLLYQFPIASQVYSVLSFCLMMGALSLKVRSFSALTGFQRGCRFISQESRGGSQLFVNSSSDSNIFFWPPRVPGKQVVHKQTGSQKAQNKCKRYIFCHPISFCYSPPFELIRADVFIAQ